MKRCAHCTSYKSIINEQRVRIQELEELLKTEQLRSGTDALTELPNRGSYDRAIVREHALAIRNKSPLTIAVLDLDYFKHVNDRYGHAIGDRILEMFARILKEERRISDFVARFGGEEFVIILPDTDVNGAQIFLERLRTSVEECLHITVSNEELRVTVSIGVAQLECRETVADLFQKADAALYRAKHSGRNRVST